MMLKSRVKEGDEPLSRPTRAVLGLDQMRSHPVTGSVMQSTRGALVEKSCAMQAMEATVALEATVAMNVVDTGSLEYSASWPFCFRPDSVDPSSRLRPSIACHMSHVTWND